ncbi:MAG: hypothetical protein Q9181_003476 [Wetmoreana brouardii]
MVSKLPSEVCQENNLRSDDQSPSQETRQTRHSHLAGYVGLLTGLGALLAVGAYLPIPTRLQRFGIAPRQALADTYYIVGATASVVGIACYFGLRTEINAPAMMSEGSAKASSFSKQVLHTISNLPEAFKLCLTNPSLGLGILASFVARASSVGISLFIPLFINARLCRHPANDIEDVKAHCRKAYVVAAQLSGGSQLFALLFAPIFGYFPFRHNRFNLPLTLATLSGIVGYVGFARLDTSEISLALLVFVALLGISQIGVIVTSLSLVSSSVVEERLPVAKSGASSPDISGDSEETMLLPIKLPTAQTHEYLKGTIAGIYSFAGSLAILVLTKLGGALFDRLGSQAPFYLLAIFNLCLLLSTLGCGVLRWKTCK